MKILPSRKNLSLRPKNRKWPMKSLDSREVTNEITGFLYFWRCDKFIRLDRIFDMFLIFQWFPMIESNFLRKLPFLLSMKTLIFYYKGVTFFLKILHFLMKNWAIIWYWKTISIWIPETIGSKMLTHATILLWFLISKYVIKFLDLIKVNWIISYIKYFNFRIYLPQFQTEIQKYGGIKMF